MTIKERIVAECRLLTTRVALVAVLLVLSAGCEGPVQIVPVPEIDEEFELPIRGLQPGATSADVQRALGNPAKQVKWFGNPALAYAVRAFSGRDRVVPAPILRIQFDTTAVVADWYFLNPRTEMRLPIKETLAEAQRFLAHWRFCSWPAGSRQRMDGIDLAAVVRNQSTMTEVTRTLTMRGNGTSNDLRCCVPFREVSNASGVAWDYHADRPSPIFLAPAYYIIEFGPNSLVTRVDYQPPFGGCE